MVRAGCEGLAALAAANPGAAFSVRLVGWVNLLGATRESPITNAMIGLHQCTRDHNAALTGDLDLFLKAEMVNPRLIVSIGGMWNYVADAFSIIG
jgi:hypothetical protein